MGGFGWWWEVLRAGGWLGLARGRVWLSGCLPGLGWSWLWSYPHCPQPTAAIDVFGWYVSGYLYMYLVMDMYVCICICISLSSSVFVLRSYPSLLYIYINI